MDKKNIIIKIYQKQLRPKKNKEKKNWKKNLKFSGNKRIEFFPKKNIIVKGSGSTWIL
jgi:thioredoxin reductase